MVGVTKKQPAETHLVDGGRQAVCQRCGAALDLVLPMEVGAFGRLVKAFDLAHRTCEAVPEEIRNARRGMEHAQLRAALDAVTHQRDTWREDYADNRKALVVLRSALQFYADLSNYRNGSPGQSEHIPPGSWAWTHDQGERARAALKEAGEYDP